MEKLCNRCQVRVISWADDICPTCRDTEPVYFTQGFSPLYVLKLSCLRLFTLENWS